MTGQHNGTDGASEKGPSCSKATRTWSIKAAPIALVAVVVLAALAVLVAGIPSAAGHLALPPIGSELSMPSAPQMGVPATVVVTLQPTRTIFTDVTVQLTLGPGLTSPALASSSTTVDLDPATATEVTFSFHIAEPGLHQLTVDIEADPAQETLHASPVRATHAVTGFVEVPEAGPGTFHPDIVVSDPVSNPPDGIVLTSQDACRSLSDEIAAVAAPVPGDLDAPSLADLCPLMGRVEATVFGNDSTAPAPELEVLKPLEPDELTPIDPTRSAGLPMDEEHTYVSACLWYDDRFAPELKDPSTREDWQHMRSMPGTIHALAGTFNGRDVWWPVTTARTMDDGCLRVGMPRDDLPEGTPIRIKFRACSSIACVVKDDIWGDKPYTWWSETTEVEAPGTWTSFPSTTAEPNAHAARTYLYITNGHEYVRLVMGMDINDLHRVKVEQPDNTECDTSCYHDAHFASAGAEYEMHIMSKHANKPEIVGHEYGHHIMEMYYGEFDVSPGGKHPPCTKADHLGFAWSEGFATFFAARVSWDMARDPFNRPGADGDHFWGAVNMEHSFDCPVGARWEFDVARALWDLVDTWEDGFDDADESPRGIGDVLGCLPSGYPALVTGVCNWSTIGYDGCAIVRASAQNNMPELDRSPPSVSIHGIDYRHWYAGVETIGVQAYDTECPDRVRVDLFSEVEPGDPCEIRSDDNHMGGAPDTPSEILWDTRATDPDDPARPLWPDGTRTRICALADDGLATGVAVTPAQVGVDNSAPVAELLDVRGTPGERGWYRSEVEVDYQCTEPHGSEMKWSEIDVNGGARVPLGGSLTYRPDGTVIKHGTFTLAGNPPIADITIHCSNWADLVGTASETYKVDTAAPSASIELEGPDPGPLGWYSDDVWVFNTCNDPVPGSGCLHSWNRVNENEALSLPFPYPVEGEGPFYIEYWSEDVAGWESTHHLLSSGIDRTPPALIVSMLGSKSAGWWTSDVEVTITCEEDLSGTLDPTYSLNGAPFRTYTGPFLVDEQGANSLSARCTNGAGLTDGNTFSFKIDSEAPLTGSFASALPDEDWWYDSPITFDAYCDDGDSPPLRSGCARIDTRLDGVVFLDNDVVTITEHGLHEFCYRSVDNAGNVAGWSCRDIRVNEGSDLWYLTTTVTDLMVGEQEALMMTRTRPSTTPVLSIAPGTCEYWVAPSDLAQDATMAEGDWVGELRPQTAEIGFLSARIGSVDEIGDAMWAGLAGVGFTSSDQQVLYDLPASAFTVVDNGFGDFLTFELCNGNSQSFELYMGRWASLRAPAGSDPYP